MSRNTLLPMALATLLIGACGHERLPSKEPSSAEITKPQAEPLLPPDNPPEPSPHRIGKLFRVDGKLSVFAGTLRETSPLSWRHPSEYCLPDGYLWRGAAYHLEDTSLFDLAIPKELVGKAVVIYGEMKPSLDQRIQRDRPCPKGYGESESSVQIRSDWVSEETGSDIGHSTHEKLKNKNYLSVTAIYELQLLEVRDQSKKTITLEILNPFNAPLRDGELLVHRERIRVKPQAIHSREKLPVISPGGQFTITIERNAGEPSTRLEDVTLTGRAGGAEVKLRKGLTAVQ